MDYDICPYCRYKNGSSMTEEYRNFALSDAEIEKMKKKIEELEAKNNS